MIKIVVKIVQRINLLLMVKLIRLRFCFSQNVVPLPKQTRLLETFKKFYYIVFLLQLIAIS